MPLKVKNLRVFFVKSSGKPVKSDSKITIEFSLKESRLLMIFYISSLDTESCDFNPLRKLSKLTFSPKLGSPFSYEKICPGNTVKSVSLAFPNSSTGMDTSA